MHRHCDTRHHRATRRRRPLLWYSAVGGCWWEPRVSSVQCLCIQLVTVRLYFGSSEKSVCYHSCTYTYIFIYIYIYICTYIYISRELRSAAALRGFCRVRWQARGSGIVFAKRVEGHRSCNFVHGLGAVEKVSFLSDAGVNFLTGGYPWSLSGGLGWPGGVAGWFFDGF
jgi:hypothetical protein